jgi:hypothetical protein
MPSQAHVVVRQAELREPTRIFLKPLDSCCPLLCLGGVRDAETVGLWGWLLLRGGRPENGGVFFGES